MAGGDNIEGGKQVVSALHSIPFGNIIGGPLAACVHAQAEASQTTLNFIRGFTMADSGIDVDGAEPVTVTFSFVMNGVPTLMTLPLMTLVPIPYMRIEHVNLSFTADITACSNEKMEARYASEGYKRTEENEKSVSVQSKMGIHVRATTSDIPSGMARMLDFFANNLIIQETLTAQEVSDMRLEAARQRAIRRNDEAEKARIEAQQAQEKARREAQEKARREEQEKRQLHRQIALLIRDLKYKKETEEARRLDEERQAKLAEAAKEARNKRLEQLKESAGRTSSLLGGKVRPGGRGKGTTLGVYASQTLKEQVKEFQEKLKHQQEKEERQRQAEEAKKQETEKPSTPQDQSAGSTSSATSGRVYPNGKGSFMGASVGSSSTGSGTSSGTSGRVYPNRRGTIMDTPNDSSSSSTPTRAYPSGKGAFMDSSSTSSTSSGSSSTTGSSSSSSTPTRAYPSGKGAFMDSSSSSSTTGSSSSSSTPNRAYPSGKGAFMDSSSSSSTSSGSSSTTGSSSSSSTPTRAYPKGKGAFMDSSSSSSTTGSSSSGTSSGSSTVGSSSSSSTPHRAYPKGKGAYLGASARSYLAGMGAAAASKAGSDDKDAKPAESQQSESQPTRAQLLRGQMPSLGKKAINIRSLRKKK